MEETKKFEKQNDGSLKITVNGKSDLSLPHEGKNIEIGKFEQVTIQYVDKDKIKVLSDFIKNQKDSAEGQIQNMKDELNKMKNIDENQLPPKLIEDCQKAIKKGSKSIKKELGNLNMILTQMVRKKQLNDQIKFLSKQLKTIKRDFVAINKGI